ncbi:ABC transporter permease [Plantactinospora sp. S1510]|uniref:ABC transporter permease n=1 Tax=Plantactinospora alkalitolerans TaxID=2789879 RepID=A0ABS0H8C0_9ACTN|nr:ABC transporter permease [Plantactinospora alkalitolerans]MBF9134700.1 ABC transporter permease [Plantactinospora alkalitolerans]
MAYDDSIYRRRETGSMDPVGAGAREDPRYGGVDPGYDDTDSRMSSGQVTGRFMGGEPAQPATQYEPDEPVRRRTVPPTALENVFDDPAHGEPGRDRMVVHLLWELVLLVVVAALAFLCNRDYPDLLRGARLESLLVFGTAVGLLTLAAALTLRAGAPNLALGPVAVAAALHFAENSDRGVVAAMLPATVAAVLLGLVVSLLVAGFHVPAWAATLAAGLAAVVFIQQRTAPVDVQGEYDPTQHATYLFGGFAAVAVLAGLFGTLKTVRRTVGRFRPVGDPALRRGAAAGVLVTLSTVISMILAVGAGLLLAAGSSGPVAPTTGIEWTGLAMGAALIGGASAFGRRGGIAGGLLAATGLTLFIHYADERNLDIAPTAVAAVVVALGLLVTRLVETYGRPRPVVGRTQEWEDEPAPMSTTSWEAARTQPPEPWTSSLPTQPTDDRADRWGGDRWGGSDR